MLRSSSRQAFTLTEFAIGLGLFGLITAGIWAAAAGVSRSYRVQQMSRDILFVINQLQPYDTNNPGSLNIGTDNGCSASKKTCTPPAGVACGTSTCAPGQTCKLTYSGTNASTGVPVAGAGNAYGLVGVTKQYQCVGWSMPTQCGGDPSAVYYSTPAASASGSFTSLAASMGAAPPDWPLNVSGSLTTSWGNASIGNYLSGDSSCTASSMSGSNSSIMSSLMSAQLASASPAPTVGINSGTPGYTQGTLSYSGSFYINFTQVPVTDCAVMLQTQASGLVSGGLQKLCISAAGSSATSCSFGGAITSVNSMPMTSLADWCSEPGSSYVTVMMVFSSTR